MIWHVLSGFSRSSWSFAMDPPQLPCLLAFGFAGLLVCRQVLAEAFVPRTFNKIITSPHPDLCSPRPRVRVAGCTAPLHWLFSWTSTRAWWATEVLGITSTRASMIAPHPVHRSSSLGTSNVLKVPLLSKRYNIYGDEITYSTSNCLTGMFILLMWWTECAKKKDVQVCTFAELIMVFEYHFF